MALTVMVDYAAALMSLLPPGLALARDPGGVLARLCAGLAAEGARIDQTASGLIDEAGPDRASALLADWERLLGLPDPLDASPPEIVSARRAVAAGRLTANAEPTAANLTAAMAALGYVVEIEEAQAEDAHCEGPCTALCETSIWSFAFVVRAPQTTVVEMTCMDMCNSPLRWWGNRRLELAVERMKPAHTSAVIRYDA